MDAPFIRAKRLRKLICQLGTSKDIEFREEDERAVLRIARHSFRVFANSAFRYRSSGNPRVDSLPATSEQNVSSLRPSHFCVAPTQVRTGSLEDEWGRKQRVSAVGVVVAIGPNRAIRSMVTT